MNFGIGCVVVSGTAPMCRGCLSSLVELEDLVDPDDDSSSRCTIAGRDESSSGSWPCIRCGDPGGTSRDAADISGLGGVVESPLLIVEWSHLLDAMDGRRGAIA
jgi:hypothetical protein